jgi:hypothetical protein
MKAYRGSRVTAPIILNIGTEWRRVVSFTPQPIHPRERIQVPNVYEAEAGRAPEPVSTFVEGENPLPILRFEPRTAHLAASSQSTGKKTEARNNGNKGTKR